MRGRIITLALAAAFLWAAPATAQTCDGFCGESSEDGSCWCDTTCFDFGDCCDDVCDFCMDSYPAECDMPCDPAETCDALGLACGVHPECDWDSDYCGACDAGFYCNQGTCEESPCEDPDDMPGCDGVTCVPAWWLGDDFCDEALYCAETGWDGGDCDPCEKDCTDLECGDDPVCGLSCGACAEGFYCTDAQVCEECLCDPAWECGSADCGTDCGECGEGFGCEDHVCVAQTCAGSCGGAGVGGCFCDATCFTWGDCCPDVCDECPDEDPEACACVPDCDGKNCGSDGCFSSCGTCEGDDSFCSDDGLCEVCDCGDKICGVDDCGNACGDNDGDCADDGYCYDGACYDGAGCDTSDTPGCDGCACEACVFAIDSYCEETEWDSYCVAQCVGVCGGCGDQAACGDGSCDYPENCSSCSEDCGCAGGLTCSWSNDVGGFDCVVGGCDEGMDMGCCDGDVLHKCVDVFGFLDVNCADDGNVCGWFAGDDDFTPGYYCGAADALVDEDPDGVYPVLCTDWTCEPDCTGIECGPDPICGTDCGTCDDGLLCEDGACVECQPDCTDLECGLDPVCGTECGPCDDGFTCDAGVCLACEPDCTDLECGPDPVCGTECGPCGDGQICNTGVCEDCTADCTDLECGLDPVCGFECGPCDDGYVCDTGVCVEDAPPMDSCEGNCGVFDEMALCNCDLECWEFGDCCDDICDFCAEDYADECEPACVPDCTDLECGLDPICGTDCGTCDEGFTCDAGVCVEDGPDCDAVCAGHCGEFAACDCGDCDAGYECLDNACELIIVEDDVIVGEEDVLVGEDIAADDTTAVEDTTDDSSGGSSSGGCTTTGGANPMAGLLVFLALMGLAVIRRRVHA